MLTEEASYSDGGSWLTAYARPREAHAIFYCEESGSPSLRRAMPPGSHRDTFQLASDQDQPQGPRTRKTDMNPSEVRDILHGGRLRRDRVLCTLHGSDGVP